jgi:catechol 2,3-dioxygenase-like lactoylglutathione lyase family enzyme
MNPQLAVVSLWAEDVPTTAHFYRDVLGLDLMAHHGGRPHFDLDGIYLTILRGKPIPAQDADPQRFPVIALAVDDLNAALAPLHTHHVDLPWGIERDEHARWAMFYDPAGNLIELVEFAA